MAKKAKEQEEEEGLGAPVEAKAVKKNDNDPVKVKCEGVSGDSSEGVTELKYEFQGKRYSIPTNGVMDGTMTRQAAEHLLLTSQRYWTMKAKLSILEPTFK